MHFDCYLRSTIILVNRENYDFIVLIVICKEKLRFFCILIIICNENEDSQSRARAPEPAQKKKKETKNNPHSPKEHSLSLSCSLSFALTHAHTPLAEHFPFGLKGYPHQTPIVKSTLLAYVLNNEAVKDTANGNHKNQPIDSSAN